MGFFDFLRPKTITKVVRVHDSDDRRGGTTYGGSRTKYGNIRYRDAGYTDYAQQRENARGVYHDSLIARGIVGRLIDNVINTGLTLESSPLWSLIPNAPKGVEARYLWTEEVENRWNLFVRSKESDHRGRLTFAQLQRLVYMLRVKEGEYFAILRYLNSGNRMSPLAIQVLNNDQVAQPFDSMLLERVNNRGAKISEGIEYDAAGQMIAIYVRENPEDFSSDPIRIPVRGPKSGRLFVIHDANFESAEQYRGFAELSAFIYELDRLTEYDITELEATIAGALWFAAIETEKGATAKPSIKPNVTTDTVSASTGGVKDGINEVRIRNRALVMQGLGPGQTFKGFQPNRPNPNFAAFEEVFENRICGSLGMPLSVFRQKFQASYSAARAEILFFWNNILRRRDDFCSGLLDPVYEAWLGEEISAGNIKAGQFRTSPVVRRAWLNCTWNGISRPVVDPVKEVNAVEKRQRLGHTTGEREAKAYNGSDFRENVKRLGPENQLIADANEPLDPAQYAEPAGDTGSDQEGVDGNPQNQ
jgi:lambda family phage portal protein